MASDKDSKAKQGKKKNTGMAKSPGKVTRESSKRKRTRETVASPRAAAGAWSDLLVDDDAQVQSPQAEKSSSPAVATLVPPGEQPASIASASLKRDDKERIYQIVYPDGTAITIEYDEQGGIKSLKTDSGSALAVEGTAAVTPQGKIVLLSSNDTGEIRRPDGHKVEILPSDVREAARLRSTTDPIDSNEEGVFALLNAWSGDQLERIDAVYWAKYDMGLDQELSDELSDEALEQARLLLERNGLTWRISE